jgi:quercetin dioxygenase-like cupin family protein
MLKVSLETLEKMTSYGAEDEPYRRVAGNFALYSVAGTKSSSVVYFEHEPGFELGNHTDGAEEIIYIVTGTVEVTIGKEKDQISSGELGVTPVMEPHNFRNIGSVTAKVIGFFSSPNVVTTFKKAFLSLNFKEFETTKLPAT